MRRSGILPLNIPSYGFETYRALTAFEQKLTLRERINGYIPNSHTKLDQCARETLIDKGIFKIGRLTSDKHTEESRKTIDYDVEDGRVSGNHVLIQRDIGADAIRDLNSAWGTILKIYPQTGEHICIPVKAGDLAPTITIEIKVNDDSYYLLNSSELQKEINFIKPGFGHGVEITFNPNTENLIPQLCRYIREPKLLNSVLRIRKDRVADSDDYVLVIENTFHGDDIRVQTKLGKAIEDEGIVGNYPEKAIVESKNFSVVLPNSEQINFIDLPEYRKVASPESETRDLAKKNRYHKYLAALPVLISSLNPFQRETRKF